MVFEQKGWISDAIWYLSYSKDSQKPDLSGLWVLESYKDAKWSCFLNAFWIQASMMVWKNKQIAAIWNVQFWNGRVDNYNNSLT